MVNYTAEQATAFENAYSNLKKAQVDEHYLERHREQILSAAEDGVADTDLIRTLKAAYADIVVTRNTLKKLRTKWASEPALTVVDTSGI